MKPRNQSLPAATQLSLADLTLPAEMVDEIGYAEPKAIGQPPPAGTTWQKVRDDRAPRGAAKASVSRNPARKPRARVNGHFLYGPVSMTWFRKAYSLCPGALIVAVELEWLRGMALRHSQVDFNQAHVARTVDVSAKVIRDGVRALEAAGLIVVSRPPGKRLSVEFCDRDAGADLPTPGVQPPSGEATVSVDDDAVGSDLDNAGGGI